MTDLSTAARETLDEMAERKAINALVNWLDYHRMEYRRFATIGGAPACAGWLADSARFDYAASLLRDAYLS